MEANRVVNAMNKMKASDEVKESSDIAAQQQAAAVAVGSCDSAIFQSLNLLPWGTKSVPNQLTIFYDGKVSVFESIGADKAREIMLMAMAAAKNTSNYNLSSNSPLLTRSPSMQSTANAFNPLCKLKAAELPITRTYSLQRFLEKRRDRLVKRAPYSTNMVKGKEANNQIQAASASPEAA